LVFHACINEKHCSRSKIPSKISRPYIYIYIYRERERERERENFKFLTLLGAPYIYVRH
jgi:hypothetical protein